MSNNPYEAPRAEVADPLLSEADSAGFETDPQTVAAGRGVDWFREGWGLFAQSPGLWIGIYLVFFAIMLAAAMFPIVGSLAQNMLFPVLTAGIMVGCDNVWRGRPLEFSDLFAGFSRNAGQLFLVGAIYTVGILLMLVIAFVPTVGLIGGMAMVGAAEPDALLGALGLPLLIGMLIWLALLVPLLMMIWFAPALVILNDMPAVDALKLSFRGCLKNVVPFLVFGLVGLGLGLLASLPLLVGWLVLMPWLATSNFCAYRDIYYRR